MPSQRDIEEQKRSGVARKNALIDELRAQVEALKAKSVTTAARHKRALATARKAKED